MKKILATFLFFLCVCNSVSAQTISNNQKKSIDENNEVIYSKQELLGKVMPSIDSSFSLVPKGLTWRKGVYVRNETLAAFQKMHDEAKNDGVNLIIVSGTRNFYDQKKIWEDKWNGWRLASGQFLSPAPENEIEQAKIILKYSSMPGTSRHHWGTDIDINSVSSYYFTTRQGRRTYEWLVQHGAEYGFCQTYNKKGEDRDSGYEEEKWHWSYMPLSIDFLNQYKKQITVEDIDDFKGSDTAEELDVLAHYIDSINPECSNNAFKN